jgi:oligogalacturonide lyase
MLSRRSFVFFALPALVRAAGRGTILPRAATNYLDRATEFPVTRLTDPSVSSLLPPATSMPISRRGFLLFASDATGRWEAYRMDIKKGESRQLTEAEALDPSSLTLLPGDSAYCYRDGPRLMTAGLAGAPREIYRTGEGFEAARGLHVTTDGLSAVLVERRGSTHRLRLIEWRTGTAVTLAEADEIIQAPVTRPKRASVLYRRAGGAYLANFDGKQNYRLRTAEGQVMQAEWSPDGRSAFYLSVPGAGKQHTIREFLPDTNEDRPVAQTTQFAAFARNADATMFVGASGAKVTPYILLLVRAAKRELTLCEHRASDVTMAGPVFSPNSQQIFFTSDLDGKPAIYGMSLDKLVTETP